MRCTSGELPWTRRRYGYRAYCILLRQTSEQGPRGFTSRGTVNILLSLAERLGRSLAATSTENQDNCLLATVPMENRPWPGSPAGRGFALTCLTPTDWPFTRSRATGRLAST